MAKIGEKLWKNERFKEWGGLETGGGFMAGGRSFFFTTSVGGTIFLWITRRETGV